MSVGLPLIVKVGSILGYVYRLFCNWGDDICLHAGGADWQCSLANYLTYSLMSAV